ncbi:alpha/beta hydrolase [Actinomadura rubrisoli]|uniref:Alpha/beta hydrolase n=1 Tax=Actinomadura rubrisoli TaxID=2530368 RepID=A0A4R5C260_9ACTN|nr:alpha/beta hydrolase [Actinomadura rubrisoli]TDD92619.1 alpha/beta hydrolase [Actinomadura rubrisoli]
MLNLAGKRAAAGTAAAAVALGLTTAAALEAPASAAARGAAAAPGTQAGPDPAPRPAGLAWTSCPAKDPVEGGRLKGLQCATIRVPLDYTRPQGEQITLALTRAPHTASRSQGAVLLNRGGPGAHGRDLPGVFTSGLPKKVAAGYDWIGYDPRGVGASKPSLTCAKSYQDPGRPRPDPIPADEREEQALTRRAKAYADECARRYRKVLPHMGSADWARDMDAIRQALRQDKISFFGYSYGTYLGAVYATMFPQRVRRMVLDSVVRPSGVWYDDNLDQNVAFEKRIRAYFAWIARHHKVYKLGASADRVAAAYARARAAVKVKPIGGRVGAAELDDVFLADGYGDYGWAVHAAALSAYVVRHDPAPLRKAWQPPGPLDHNNYAVYNAVQCRDAAWPRDWSRWHADSERLYRAGYRFETWSNTWYNAPCAFWGVPGGPPPAVGTAAAPPMLLVQGTEDAATPYAGALETHRRFPRSRLLVETGGGNHGVSLTGDKCVDAAVARYLGTGGLPAGRPGADAKCPAGPPPEPTAAKNGRRDGQGAAQR